MTTEAATPQDRPDRDKTEQPEQTIERLQGVIWRLSDRLRLQPTMPANSRALVAEVLRELEGSWTPDEVAGQIVAKLTEHPDASARQAPCRDVITVPRPHVPYGPEGINKDEADADFLRDAADRLESFYRPFGSNLRATVVRLLRDAADAIPAAGLPADGQDQVPRDWFERAVLAARDYRHQRDEAQAKTRDLYASIEKALARAREMREQLVSGPELVNIEAVIAALSGPATTDTEETRRG
ncbi:hypothetical protein [Amycolatopsis thermophila]|uniref:Uncharacterized protein n=1 Tax=Amycolatopsis thermophila TaxID=206084 RepID=A0ABU0ENF0_9PSEU|nr:hypothetical protein [Amycolatopsis thermophila]MDQ0376568.1 hypothetical protein [Amycolatopsis thermophila]